MTVPAFCTHGNLRVLTPMGVFVRIVVTVALFATTSTQEQVGIHLSFEGRLIESGLRFSPSGETRYRVSDYMQQLWMASGAQTLATRGEATACSSVDWTEESARFECPLGRDDYTFAFTYDARDGASVLRVHNVGTGARVDPVQLESLVWELPGAEDQEALNRAEIADITTTVDVKSVVPDGTSRSRQASGVRQEGLGQRCDHVRGSNSGPASASPRFPRFPPPGWHGGSRADLSDRVAGRGSLRTQLLHAVRRRSGKPVRRPVDEPCAGGQVDAHKPV